MHLDVKITWCAFHRDLSIWSIPILTLYLYSIPHTNIAMVCTFGFLIHFTHPNSPAIRPLLLSMWLNHLNLLVRRTLCLWQGASQPVWFYCTHTFLILLPRRPHAGYSEPFYIQCAITLADVKLKFLAVFKLLAVLKLLAPRKHISFSKAMHTLSVITVQSGENSLRGW